MGFVAIDKHSRKILGYLCRNDRVLTYCCSACDDEFSFSKDLEMHMEIHEKNANCTDRSEVDRETQLRSKYQVTPCSVQLFRFDDDNEDDDHHHDDGGDERNIDDQENIVLPKNTPVKNRTGIISQVRANIARKRKLNQSKAQKCQKKKALPVVCFLCGQQFQTCFEKEQHQRTHQRSSANAPVFPCSVCGKNVKNLKIHLRQHENDPPKKTPDEPSSSTDVVITTTAETTQLETSRIHENVITSNLYHSPSHENSMAISTFGEYEPSQSTERTIHSFTAE